MDLFKDLEIKKFHSSYSEDCYIVVSNELGYSRLCDIAACILRMWIVAKSS